MILCCGEALIDMIPEPTISGTTGFVPFCGGAVFNTAIALGRLGASAGLLTGLSHDMFGQKLMAMLEYARVDTSHIIYSDRPTTLAFVELTNGQAAYTFVDENSAGRMLTPADMPTIDPSVTALYFGGISLACEPGADAYAALLTRQGDTRAIMLDPNIRAGFIEDEARYRDRLDRMMAKSDIVKVSDEDLNWIVGGDHPLQDKAREVLANGPSVVIVTQGASGATAYLRNGDMIHVPAKMVEIVDTVGAGDTFNAGVLAWLSKAGLLDKIALQQMGAEAMEGALAFGARVAAVTVSRAGSNSPWAHELEGTEI